MTLSEKAREWGYGNTSTPWQIDPRKVEWMMKNGGRKEYQRAVANLKTKLADMYYNLREHRLLSTFYRECCADEFANAHSFINSLNDMAFTLPSEKDTAFKSFIKWSRILKVYEEWE